MQLATDVPVLSASTHQEVGSYGLGALQLLLVLFSMSAQVLNTGTLLRMALISSGVALRLLLMSHSASICPGWGSDTGFCDSASAWGLVESSFDPFSRKVVGHGLVLRR